MKVYEDELVVSKFPASQQESWYSPSSGKLHGVGIADVSGQNIGLILKDQTLK